MPYKISDIQLEIESSKITISTSLQYYIVVPEQIIPAEPPSPEFPEGRPERIIPAYDRVDWSKSLSSSCKVNPFNNASLTSARPILVTDMEKQMLFHKRLMDKQFEIKNSGILDTLKTNIMAKLALIP